MAAARDSSLPGSLAYWFMDWRHLEEILAAGTKAYNELLNLCVWTKTNAGPVSEVPGHFRARELVTKTA